MMAAASIPTVHGDFIFEYRYLLQELELGSLSIFKYFLSGLQFDGVFVVLFFLLFSCCLVGSFVVVVGLFFAFFPLIFVLSPQK